MRRAVRNGVVLAEAEHTIRVGNHYFPMDSLNLQHFAESGHTSVCPWKGSATDRALHHQAAGGWSRIGWEQIGRITWDHHWRTLAVTDAGPARVAEMALHPADGPRLTDLARERVGSTFLPTTRMALTHHRHAQLTARASPDQPGSDRTLWQVDLGSDADPADPSVPTEIATTIARLRTHFDVRERVGISRHPDEARTARDGPCMRQPTKSTTGPRTRWRTDCDQCTSQ